MVHLAIKNTKRWFFDMNRKIWCLHPKKNLHVHYWTVNKYIITSSLPIILSLH